MNTTIVSALIAGSLLSSNVAPKAEAGFISDKFNSVKSFFVKKEKKEIYRARVTYYTVGEDKWGDLVACPNTPRAKEGITVAAHPDFPFGTKVKINALKGKVGNGEFTVQDRGSAVTKKRAARGKAYVFDVFVINKPRMNKHARHRPMYMDIEVLERPTDG